MFYFTCNESKIYESFTYINNLQDKYNNLQEKNNFHDILIYWDAPVYVSGVSYWFQCCQVMRHRVDEMQLIVLSCWIHSSLSPEQHSTHTPVEQIFSGVFSLEWQNEEMSEKVTLGKYWALVASLFHHFVLQAWIIPQILQLIEEKCAVTFQRDQVCNFCLADDQWKKSRALWFTQSWKCKWYCRIIKWKMIMIKKGVYCKTWNVTEFGKIWMLLILRL